MFLLPHTSYDFSTCIVHNRGALAHDIAGCRIAVRKWLEIGWMHHGPYVYDKILRYPGIYRMDRGLAGNRMRIGGENVLSAFSFHWCHRRSLSFATCAFHDVDFDDIGRRIPILLLVLNHNKMNWYNTEHGKICSTDNLIEAIGPSFHLKTIILPFFHHFMWDSTGIERNQ